MCDAASQMFSTNMEAEMCHIDPRGTIPSTQIWLIIMSPIPMNDNKGQHALQQRNAPYNPIFEYTVFW